MNWIQKIALHSPNYQYMGTCLSTVDDDCIWDATQMAQIIEGSSPFDIQSIFPFLHEELSNKVQINPGAFVAGNNGRIVWVHDLDADVHYFYEEI